MTAGQVVRVQKKGVVSMVVTPGRFSLRATSYSGSIERHWSKVPAQVICFDRWDARQSGIVVTVRPGNGESLRIRIRVPPLTHRFRYDRYPSSAAAMVSSPRSSPSVATDWRSDVTTR